MQHVSGASGAYAKVTAFINGDSNWDVSIGSAKPLCGEMKFAARIISRSFMDNRGSYIDGRTDFKP
jgi:hypothetical protein